MFKTNSEIIQEKMNRNGTKYTDVLCELCKVKHLTTKEVSYCETYIGKMLCYNCQGLEKAKLSSLNKTGHNEIGSR